MTSMCQTVLLLSFASLLLTPCLALAEESDRGKPQLVVQAGHTDRINTVAISPDGSTILTGSNDKTAILWNAATGLILRKLNGHSSGVDVVGFSNDGNHIITSDHSSAIVWETRTGKKFTAFQGTQSRFLARCVAVAPDCASVVTCDDNGTAEVWDASTAKLLQTLQGHVLPICCVTFSHDGERILTGSDDKTAILWDVKSGKPLHILKEHTSNVHAVGFSPDGRHVITESFDDRIYITSIRSELESGRQLQIQQRFVETGSTTPGNTAVFFSAHGNMLLTGSDDYKTTFLWDLKTGKKQQMLKGSTGQIRAVAFSPDGRLVATGADGKVILWDANSGNDLRTFEGHSSGVVACAFSSDGKQLLTGSWDKTAILWDVATGRSLHIIRGHAGSVTAVAFSPEGKRLATGSDDRTAVVWDAITGQEIRKLQGHRKGINAVAFSPDGTKVATGASDNAAIVWDPTTGISIRRFEGHTRGVFAASFTPDSKGLVTGAWDEVAILWDLDTGKPLQKFPRHASLGGGVFGSSVTLSPDYEQVSTHLIDKSGYAKVDVWDALSGEKVHTFRKTRFKAFRPNSRELLTTSRNSSASIWDLASGEQLHSFLNIDEGTLAYNPDGRHLVMSTWKDVGDDYESEFLLCDAATGQQLRAFSEDMLGGIESVAFSRDGKQVLTGTGNIRVNGSGARAYLRDVDTGRTLRRFHGEAKPIRFVDFSRDDKGVMFGPSLASMVEIDVATMKKLRTVEIEALKFTDSDLPFSVSPSGDRLAFAFVNQITLHDLAARKEHSLSVAGLVRTLAFSPDGNRLATGGDQIIIWNAITGDRVRTIGTPNSRVLGNGVFSVAFSPDGKRVLTGSSDGKAVLWDVGTGVKVLEFGANDGIVFVAFSPDGKQVLTGIPNGTAILWRASTAEKICDCVGHTDRIIATAFSRDGKRLLTGSRDGTARLWESANGREICSIVDAPDGVIAVTPDMFYKADKSVLQSRIAFRVGDRVFPFSQFDHKFNRPDIVLSRTSLAPSALVDAYQRSYQKRLHRMNFTDEMLSSDFHMPEVALQGVFPLAIRDRTFTFTLRAVDATYLLDRIHVYVNGVPHGGTNGISLRGKRTLKVEHDVTLELSAGKNVIRVSVVNERGVESLGETRMIVCEAPTGKPDRYVIVVGVSEYRDDKMNLKYASKDARDLAAFLERESERIGSVKVLRLLDADATRDNILKAKELLLKSRVDDEVVVFFAGHGLLDRNYDYFFATVDVDFKDPVALGLPYEAIERMLGGIAARKKLLLMDTCHAGELDEDDVKMASTFQRSSLFSGVRARGVGGAVRVNVKNLKISHELLPEAFADLRHGTGAAVISAAGGLEFSFEGAKWKNGVFTHAVLQGLKNKEADNNKDGRVQVSELRDYVLEEVQRLTSGRQRPTTRRENLELDFVVH